jgi:alpha-1,2-mannosyltransferase
MIQFGDGMMDDGSQEILARQPTLAIKQATDVRLDRLSRIIWLLLVLICIAFCIYLVTRAKYAGEDSWHPMREALNFLRAPQALGPVYQKLFFTDHIKFQYPPTALLSFDLLSAVGITTSNALNLINAGLLIATGLAFAMFSTQVLGPMTWFGVGLPIGPVAFLLAIRFYPNNLAFQIGQMQILLGLLYLLACWAFLNQRLAWAGALIGMAATVKPQFAPLALLALWRRQWTFFAALAAVGAAAFLLSVALYGWRTHLDYLTVLDFLSKHGEYQHLNQSINGLLVRWLYLGPSLDRDPQGLIPQSAFPPFIQAVYVATLVSTLIMLVIPFVVQSKSDDRMSRLLAFCGASALFTMASPIAWVHHYNILLPVYVVALRAAFDRWEGARAHIALSLLALSLVAVGYPLVPANAPTVPSMNIVQSHVLMGAFLLIGVLLVELRTPLRKTTDDLRIDPA